MCDPPPPQAGSNVELATLEKASGICRKILLWSLPFSRPTVILYYDIILAEKKHVHLAF